jgi:hypothetical protein
MTRWFFQAIESLTASADHRTNDLSMPLADVTAVVACSYKACRAEAQEGLQSCMSCNT